MPAKKPYKVDIDVIPYLSIMAIVLKLICLILIVMVMRIAVNPEALKVVRYPTLYQPPEEAGQNQYIVLTNEGTVYTNVIVAEKQISRSPVFFDCHPDRLEIHPENIVVPLSELREPGGDFEITMEDIKVHASRKMAVLITRPNSAPVYRYVRRQALASGITVGYDVLESDVIIAWTGELARLEIKIDTLNAVRQARDYGQPLEVMTSWIAQAKSERTNLAFIAERVKSGKRFNEKPEPPPMPKGHH